MMEIIDHESADIRINNKGKMYELLKRGVFGNTVRHYNSLKEMLDDPNVTLVGCRCTKVNRPWGLYQCTKRVLVEGLKARGVDGKTGFEFYESPPDEYRTIQGEVCRGVWGLHFRYTFEMGPMRIALKIQEHNASGSMADAILRRYTDPSCYEWLMELLDKYQDHVVEFTNFSVPCGVLQLPYLIWEVRAY